MCILHILLIYNENYIILDLTIPRMYNKIYIKVVMFWSSQKVHKTRLGCVIIDVYDDK